MAKQAQGRWRAIRMGRTARVQYVPTAAVVTAPVAVAEPVVEPVETPEVVAEPVVADELVATAVEPEKPRRRKKASDG